MRTLFAALDAEASNFAEVPGTGARRAEIVIESQCGKLPIAVVRPAEAHVRFFSESLLLAQEHAKELGHEATLYPDFATDLEEIINSCKPRQISSFIRIILDTSVLIAGERRGENVQAIVQRVAKFGQRE
ncbi:MAG: hypothetical protein JO159_08375 [Acidobacteria bacterium]|nr:hypothetical protein [Acidobacteriota bacterium]